MERIETDMAVLLTVHDRKNKTLRCSENLYKQILPSYLRLDIYLIDDGCTDETPGAIKRQFPRVHIIKGGGNLFRNRGMYGAWEKAAKQDYNFYPWLNDDNYLFDGVLLTLLGNSAKYNHQTAVVAPMRLREEGVTTCNGYDSSQKITPSGKLQECEKFNENCASTLQCVFEKVDNLDWIYRHAIGNIDYGYRIRKTDFKDYVAIGYLGICGSDPRLPAWTRKEVPFIRRIKNLYPPLEYVGPIPFFLFEKRHIRFMIAVRHFITVHIEVLLPQL